MPMYALKAYNVKQDQYETLLVTSVMSCSFKHICGATELFPCFLFVEAEILGAISGISRSPGVPRSLSNLQYV